MNWTLQLLSHSFVFLFHLISLGTAHSCHRQTFASEGEKPKKFHGLWGGRQISDYLQIPPSSSLRALLPRLGGAPKLTLCLLDEVQPKAYRLINNLNFTKPLQRLSHRRLAGKLSIFYRFFHGHCFQETRDIMPDPLVFVRATKSSMQSHRFQNSLPLYRTSYLPLPFQNPQTSLPSNPKWINFMSYPSNFLAFL